jgi:molybdopterin-containing oxidoreductase family iron-sulfur binding subunit
MKLENVPVIVQPGQAIGGFALGYGRMAALKKKYK